MNSRAALGAHDDVQFCLVNRTVAERRNIGGECHLHCACSLVAQERDGHIGGLKSTVIRIFFPEPDELLSFLHAFLQGSSDWCNFKDGRIERHRFHRIWCCLLWGVVCARPGDATSSESAMSAARRVSLIVIYGSALL